MAKTETEAMRRLAKRGGRKKGKAVSVWADVRYRLLRNGAAIFGMTVILILLLFALFPKLFVQYGYDDQDYSQTFIAPCIEHPMGTDNLGRDVFCRIVYGTRISLTVGAAAMMFSLLVGGILGAIAAVYGGWLDNLIMRTEDIFMAIPYVLMAIAICAALGTGIVNLIIAIAIADVPSFARTVRAAIITVRNQDYIEAARAVGASKMRLVIRHMIPNAMGPIIVHATMDIAGAITTAAALSFIGLGVAPPTPEWGCMLSDAKQFITDFDKWYVVAFPGLIIMLTVFAFNMLGDGLRDAFDPKLKD